MANLFTDSSTEKVHVPSEPSVSPAIEEINEKALLRKIDAKLLPAVGVLYLLSFLDRSNVGNARIEGLLNDINATWGIVATLLGIVHNLAGFFVARFFLGVTESGLFPGVVFYFSMWYRRRERQYRISLFFSAASLAGAFGGILAFEGLATIAIAFAAYWFIENYPETSKFLSQSEKEFIQARLAADSDATHHEKFTWSAVYDAFRDANCWLYGLGFHTMSLPLYTLSLFLPTIIKDLGYTAATAQLLTIPPYALAFVTTLAVAIYSERLARRAVFIAASAIVAAIGYIILLSNTNPKARPAVSYVGTFFAAAGIYPATALVLSWPAINVSGQTKRATANAMQISIGNLGAVLGTQLYRSNDGPRFVVGHAVALAYLVANVAVVSVLAWKLRKQNLQRAEVADEVVDVGRAEDWKGDGDARWRFQY
ncbi:MFS transporter [Metarhizium anisopliae]|nr:MFS transporter [Metarhizium anisopliae]